MSAPLVSSALARRKQKEKAQELAPLAQETAMPIAIVPLLGTPLLLLTSQDNAIIRQLQERITELEQRAQTHTTTTKKHREPR